MHTKSLKILRHDWHKTASRTIIACCLVMLLLGVVTNPQSAFGDGLSSDEVKALNNYPNWVADNGNSCGNTVVSGTGVLPTDNSPFPFAIPATHGKTGREEAIDEGGHVASTGHPVSFAKYAALGQAYRNYYIAMRWTFSSWSWDGHNKIVDQKQLDQFTSGDKPILVLVTNTRTGKSIIADAIETGPGPSVGSTWRAQHNNQSSPAPPWWQGYLTTAPSQYDGLVAGFPPPALDALDAQTGYSGEKGDDLLFQWAPNQNATPGPTNQVASGGAGCSTGGTAGANGWDLTGPNAMVLYEQYDPKYANKSFGHGNIADCGCGPTSMAMAIATLTGDASVTPPVVAAYYAAHGGEEGTCGSNWSWNVLSQRWPIKIKEIGNDPQAAAATIKAGGFVLVSYTGAPFTSVGHGHIFLIRAVADDGGFFVANPLGHFAGDKWANQNTVERPANYFDGTAHTSTDEKNPGSGVTKDMWAITKE